MRIAVDLAHASAKAPRRLDNATSCDHAEVLPPLYRPMLLGGKMLAVGSDDVTLFISFL